MQAQTVLYFYRSFNFSWDLNPQMFRLQITHVMHISGVTANYYNKIAACHSLRSIPARKSATKTTTGPESSNRNVQTAATANKDSKIQRFFNCCTGTSTYCYWLGCSSSRHAGCLAGALCLPNNSMYHQFTMYLPNFQEGFTFLWGFFEISKKSVFSHGSGHGFIGPPSRGCGILAKPTCQG